MSAAMLTLTQVSKRYRAFTFGPVNFQLEQGTIVALVGPNGSGKSTFFRLIMKLIRQDDGTIEWFGKTLTHNETAIKQIIGFVSSGLYDIFGYMTIRELSGLISHWYPNWDDEQFHELIGRYGIDLNAKYGECSTGTRKKVDFIMAITHRPALLLLDEPSAGVDMMSQRRMKEDLLAYMEDGSNSVIIATHQQEEVQQICDYICILRQGRIIRSFEKDELHHQWARLWISSLPDTLRHHPNVKDIKDTPLQIVTDRLPDMEQLLSAEGIVISHMQRLELNEIIEYCLVEEDVKTHHA